MGPEARSSRGCVLGADAPRAVRSTAVFLEDRSPRGAALGELAQRLRQSPVMVAQRARLQGIFGARPARPLAGPVAQLSISRPAAVETATRNVATAWMGGGDYAVTPSIINGKEIPPTTNKTGLIRPPILDFLEDTSRPPATRYRLQMTVPDQSVSYRLELPADGPWDLARPTTVEEVDAFIGQAGQATPMRTPLEEAKPASLRILPDGDLKGQIRAHEMHHVREQDQAVNEILVPWDAELDRIKILADQLTNRGPLELLGDYDPIEPEKAQTIADRLVARLKDLGQAYHATPEGRDPVVTGWRVVDPAAATWAYEVRLKLDKV